MSTGCSNGPTMLRTLRGEVTLEEAMAEEHNMLHRLTYWQKRCDLLDYLSDHRAQIEAVVSHHLNLGQNGACFLAPISEWIHGSFNICLPVNVKDRKCHSGKRVLIRFPLPYKSAKRPFLAMRMRSYDVKPQRKFGLRKVVPRFLYLSYWDWRFLAINAWVL